MNNAGAGEQDSSLTIFGGLVAEINPTELPEGAAAIACDVDYTIGSVKTRYGVENVYTYEGSDETAVGTSFESIGPGDVAWTSPSTFVSFLQMMAVGGAGVNPKVGTTTAAGVAIGDLLLVSVMTASTGASNPDPVTSLVDGLGNTYLPLCISLSFTDFAVNTATFQVFYCFSAFATSSPFTVTTHWGSTPTSIDTICLVKSVGPTSFDQVVTGVFARLTGSDVIGPLTVSDSEMLISYAVWDLAVGGLTSYPAGYDIFLPAGLGPGDSGFSGCGAVDQAVTPGTYDATWIVNNAGLAGMLASFHVPSSGTWEVTVTPGETSEFLTVQGFGFSIPASSTVLGIQVVVNGNQSIAGPTLSASILGGDPKTFELPLSTGTVTLGGPSDLWGDTWTPAEINNPGFGFSFQASDPSSTVTFALVPPAVTVTVWFTPPGLNNFNFVGSFEQTDGTLLTLALDDNGTFWQEDVLNDPDVLAPFYTAIEPDTFARAAVIDDRDFIALSDLVHGTDMPRQYNGKWVDRVSQVGPGVAPSFSATSTAYNIVNITQPAAVVNGSTGNPIRAMLWSTGPGVKWQAGSVITIEYTLATSPPDPNIYVGGGVVLSGFTVAGGDDPNGSYLVVSVQQTDTGNSLRNSFSVQAPHVANHYMDPPTSASYQATLSTLTLSAPAPGVQVGVQVLIAGTSQADLNATWTILNALNASQMQITATSLASDIATYDFVLISGTAPVVGQQVTVTGTTNGDGIFNVVNGIITSASPSNFALTINSPDIPAAAESSAQAIVNGTIFQFDPAPTWVGPTSTTPIHPFIFGTSTGGTIAQQGQLGAGPRRGVCMFLTRNGFLTPTSPYSQFTLNEGSNAIVATNIPIGPPNVIARVIGLTGANGGFYFWIPQPVTVTSNGQQVTYDATIIHDNVTTSATFNITDAVLLAAFSIDTEGSNNFAEIELGSSLGFVAYSQRMFAWGEQNKVQNFINLSFDGGYVSQNPSTPITPAGWTVDPTNGAGGQLIVSQLFGNSYYIKNASGMTQAIYGLISQTAFQDQLATPILTVQTQYSVRVTARCPSGVTSGNLVIDLFSPSFNRVYGSFTIPLASMSNTMKIFTGTLLTTAFTTSVPMDLQYRIYATALPDGGDVELDRTEPFDTAQPVLTTQLRGSYFNNFEAFDGVTGNLGVAVQNQQEVRNAFELFDILYIVKTNSFVQTIDNGITEPDGWTIKEVSNKVGTPSINGVDVGESWALVAGVPGVYAFQGGKPQKISPEIDPLWRSINWKYGYTLWIKNDTDNRRILIGVPLATPNQWMPNFPVNANPTQPNVVLTCTYKELMSATALENEGAIRQGYTGQLRAFQLGRRWSVWSIEAAYADFIKRGDNTTPIFFCGDTDTGKIYQQITGNYFDDGHGLFDLYVTYPFLQSQEAQQIHAGLHELLATYASTFIIGSGNINITVLPDSLGTPYGDALDPIPLGNPPAWGDTEFPLNEVGNRFFVWYETKNPGDWFELSKLVLTVTQSPWSPVRGMNG